MNGKLHDHSTVEGIVEHAQEMCARIGTPRTARYLDRSRGGYPTIEFFDPNPSDEPIASVLATEVRTMIQEGTFEAWITEPLKTT